MSGAGNDPAIPGLSAVDCEQNGAAGAAGPGDMRIHGAAPRNRAVTPVGWTTHWARTG